MDVKEALINRKSTRAFLDKDIDSTSIAQILDSAAHAPSGTNTQPWQVAVVSGDTKQKLQEKIEATFRGGDKGKADYSYYPNEWKEPFVSRRKECGLLMYKTLGIERTDRERQTDQWAANYRAFDAPVLLLFFMDSAMQEGSYMDYGMFLQSIMLAALGALAWIYVQAEQKPARDPADRQARVARAGVPEILKRIAAGILLGPLAGLAALAIATAGFVALQKAGLEHTGNLVIAMFAFPLLWSALAVVAGANSHLWRKSAIVIGAGLAPLAYLGLAAQG